MVKLRELRRMRGFTQQQLADMVGVSNVSLSNYERGAQAPDIEILVRLADALGVSLDVLLGRTTEANGEQPITQEARILAKGIDKLPQEQREQALDVVKAMFAHYSDYFNKETSNES